MKQSCRPHIQRRIQYEVTRAWVLGTLDRLLSLAWIAIILGIVYLVLVGVAL